MKRTFCAMLCGISALGFVAAPAQAAYIHSGEENLTLLTTMNYRVTIEKPLNGYIEVSSQNPPAGRTVIVTVTGDEKFELKELYIIDKRGLPVFFTELDDGTFSYVQGDREVTISAEMQRIGGELTALTFDDVTEDSWFYPYADDMVKREVLAGTSATQFSPYSMMTRGMFASIVTFIDRADVSEQDIFLDDTPEDTWYSKHVNWCVDKNLMSVQSARNFNGDAVITREDLAMTIYHYATFIGMNTAVYNTTNLNGFVDKDDITSSRANALSWAVKNNIVAGNVHGELNPQDGATRAEVCVMLSVFLEARDFLFRAGGLSPTYDTGYT